MERGNVVGRYTILAAAGAGAAGEVFTAFDPELNRKVALKLLPATGEGGAAGARLLDEAKALARLSHPNVVKVHDVGTFEARVFVAMELVEGVTLEDWLRQERRTRAEILPVFSAAARGLAAAHDAGVIHGGFTARDVTIARDGAVRVTDFGLERAGAGDAGADQLAFCVALDAALGAGAPGWLKHVVQRGLAPVPGERWPSMEALARALARDPARGRRRAAVAAGVSVLVALAGATLVRNTRQAPVLCGGGPARLAGAWEPPGGAQPRREAIRAAFLASGAPAAAEVWERVGPALDGYAARWLAAYGDACQATHVSRAQSAAVLDLRMGCLDERRTALAALADVFAKADRGVVGSAVDAVNALPTLDRCADLKLLEAPIQPPPDEATRRRVEDVHKRAAVAKAVNDTGKHEEAIALTRALLKEARDIGYKPLLAEMLDAHTTAHSGPNFRADIVPLMEETVWVGLASGRDDLAAAAATARVAAIGYTALFDQTTRWVGLAETMLARLSSGPEQDLLRSWLYTNEATVKLHQHDAEGALPVIRRAVALKEKVLPPNHPDIATSLNSEAEALASLGRLDEALRLNERTRQIFAAAYGPASTEIAYTLSNRGEYLVALERPEEALAPLRQSLSVWQAQVGPEHQFLAFPLTATGRALVALGRPHEALPVLERAVRLRVAREPDQLLVADSRFALARALAASGTDLPRALSLARAARGAYDQAAAAKPRTAVDAWLATLGAATPTPRGGSPETAP
jgi:tetratricopeptide (TPR) repeat protein